MLKVFLVLILLAPFLSSASKTMHSKRLLVAADEWCPYNCQPNTSNPGYLIEVLQLVFNPRGYAIDYKILPWKRALIETELARIDAAVGAVEANHGSNIIGRQHLGFDQTILVVRKSQASTFIYPTSLEGASIGVIADYTYDNFGELDKYLAKRMADKKRIYMVHQKKPLDSLFKMLMSKRIDVFPENHYVALNKANQLKQLENVGFIDISLGDKVYIAFKPTEEGKELSQILDNGIEVLMQNGELEKVLMKYKITPWFTIP